MARLPLHSYLFQTKSLSVFKERVRQRYVIETKNQKKKITNLLSYSYGGQNPKMGLSELKSRCWQDGVPSGSSKGESVFSSI